MRKRLRAVKIVLGILYLAITGPDEFLAGFETGKKLFEDAEVEGGAVCSRTNLH